MKNSMQLKRSTICKWLLIAGVSGLCFVTMDALAADSGGLRFGAAQGAAAEPVFGFRNPTIVVRVGAGAGGGKVGAETFIRRVDEPMPAVTAAGRVAVDADRVALPELGKAVLDRLTAWNQSRGVPTPVAVGAETRAIPVAVVAGAPGAKGKAAEGTGNVGASPPTAQGQQGMAAAGSGGGAKVAAVGARQALPAAVGGGVTESVRRAAGSNGASVPPADGSGGKAVGGGAAVVEGAGAGAVAKAKAVQIVRTGGGGSPAADSRVSASAEPEASWMVAPVVPAPVVGGAPEPAVSTGGGGLKEVTGGALIADRPADAAGVSAEVLTAAAVDVPVGSDGLAPGGPVGDDSEIRILAGGVVGGLGLASVLALWRRRVVGRRAGGKDGARARGGIQGDVASGAEDAGGLPVGKLGLVAMIGGVSLGQAAAGDEALEGRRLWTGGKGVLDRWVRPVLGPAANDVFAVPEMSALLAVARIAG